MRIVLLSDGTGDAAASIWRTNVWRVFESLERIAQTQVVLYDDGVGTSSFLPSALLGLVFGRGLKANVLHFYKFLCRTYSPGDEIFAFGFSRGAFTIHTVIGLIADQGLVTFETEADLHRKAKAAYRAYRLGKAYPGYRWPTPIQTLRGWFGTTRYDPTTNRQVDSVRFVGLWDTVAAYGLPFEEVARGLGQFLSTFRLPDRRLSKIVLRACHAICLDDERTAFHPILFDEREEVRVTPRESGRRYLEDERVSQVWFSGVHANVGGGYPDDSLAHVSLYWMMQEAATCGLRFKQEPESEPDAFKTTISMRDTNGRLYDSREGLQRLYFYAPRKVFEFCHTESSETPEASVEISLPKIHQSVFDRIKSGIDLYGPLGLPADFEIVADDGTIVPSESFEPLMKSRARAELLERAWNLVWWRRITNLAIAAVSTFLIAYPIFIYLPDSPAVWPLLAPLFGILRIIGTVPVVDLWTTAYTRSPALFIATIFVIVGLCQIGSKLKKRINDKKRRAWTRPIKDWDQGNLPVGLTYRFRTSRFYKFAVHAWRHKLAPPAYAGLYACLFLYLVAAALNRVTLLEESGRGVFCRNTAGPGALGKSFAFPINDACFATGIKLKKNSIYRITIKQDGAWSDGNILTSMAGYRLGDIPTVRRPVIFLSQLFKRNLSQPFFMVMMRIGQRTNEEEPISENHTASVSPFDGQGATRTFRAKWAGDLFLHVNDVVVGIPGYVDWFYRDNQGAATVIVDEVHDSDEVVRSLYLSD
jgi:uncharacterized protein (DUF2235 family)